MSSFLFNKLGTRIRGCFAILAAMVLIPASLFAEWSSLAITEILKNPAGAEDAVPGGRSHEFIELSNLGDQAVSIDSMFLYDGGEIDSVVPWTLALPQQDSLIINVRSIPAGKTALILDRDYAGAPSTSLFAIDSGTIVFTTNDNDLGNTLAEDDGIVIYKGTKSTVIRVLAAAVDEGQDLSLSPHKIYHMAGRRAPEGFSVIPTQVLFSPAAWMPCPDSLSPGHYENGKNGWIAEWKLGSIDAQGGTIACSLSCWKAGGVPAADVYWCIRTPGANARTIIDETKPAFSAGPALMLAHLPLDTVGYALLVRDGASLSWPIDISTEWAPVSAIKITEIFPRATPDCPEWIEVTNISSMPINLKGWMFGNSEDTVKLSDYDLAVQPAQFVVIVKDPALFSKTYHAFARTAFAPGQWHTLDNYDDTLRLWNSKGNLQETVCWHNEWFSGWTAGSLERITMSKSGIDRAAWVVATMPTPGQPNGSVTWRAASQASMEIGPIPFSPNGDGKDDLLAIKLQLPASATAVISIYGFNGMKAREIAGPAQETLYWDGKNRSGRLLPPGPFFVVADIKDFSGNRVIRKKGVLWK